MQTNGSLRWSSEYDMLIIVLTLFSGEKYVSCEIIFEDDIRLAADGRLEVLYNGQWEQGGISIGNSVNDGSGKIWLDNLRCKGSEGMLAECRRNDWGIHDCTHPEDVGIRCDSIDRVTEGGLWGNWLSWSVCSTSCGAGIQKRQRNCDSPPPYLGGGYCSGLPLESRSCNNMCCPMTDTFGNPKPNITLDEEPYEKDQEK
ncbi:LOXL2_3_4 [Mytilus edulis]|uniref:LOXL2_3_4 n=1 Tax=Mytilus edulis TaxID=6550 RepID=A0A8S3QG11_MYTED|nr:LOXL2_3_4 [Mytilus edulis]